MLNKPRSAFPVSYRSATRSAPYLIAPGEQFYSQDFPLIVREIAALKMQLSHLVAGPKSDMIISFYKDHSLQNTWVKDFSKVTYLITGRTLTAPQLESLFQDCRLNQSFTDGLERYIHEALKVA